jgi:5-formyltetrahydrofolate cyclo-ligase
MSNESLRKEKLAARQALGAELREALSQQICNRLSAMSEFQAAKNIMLYRAVRGEVQLDSLSGKDFSYPLCISDSEMIALRPKDSRSWKSGYCGILEPIPELSTELKPAELDLVVCPCTAFDSALHRLGMGKGFYDRFLSKCSNAVFVAVAFEAQRADFIEAQSWDIAMDIAVTEKEIYR